MYIFVIIFLSMTNVLSRNFIFWISIFINAVNIGYCGCPFMKKALEKSKQLYDVDYKLKQELFDAGLIVSYGQPGASNWNDLDITDYQKEIVRNASIGLMAGQLYSQTLLMASDGQYLSRRDRLAKIKSMTKYVPEEYRCRVLDEACRENDPYQAIDGKCNNLLNPALGASYTPYNRWLSADYNDGLYAIRRQWLTNDPLKSARAIGNYIYKKSNYKHTPSRIASVNALFFGQYIAHDSSIHLTYQLGRDEQLMRCCSANYNIRLPNNLQNVGCFPIDIPRNDEYYSKYNMKCMEFVRLAPAFPRDCTLGAIEPSNSVTSYVDKSILYGASKSLTDSLRTKINGTLKTNKYGNFPVIPNCTTHDWNCYLIGVATGTQSIWLTTVILVNLHFHNYLAKNLAIINPHWDDEKLFQEARRIFIALNYHFIYDEWIPLFVGEEFAEQYSLDCTKTWPYCNYYNQKMDGTTLNEFIHGAMRLFHQFVPQDVNFYNKYNKIYKTTSLSTVINQPEILNKNFVGALRGMLFDRVNVLNTYSYDIRTKVFNNYQKQGVGFDVSSIDIQRGRDLGVPPYYQYMDICNRVMVTEWSDLEPNFSKESIETAQKMYDSVFDMDLITGIFLENKHNYMGPVARCIISEQFKRFRIGDRYYYTNQNRPHPFTIEQLYEINNYTYAKMICSKGDLTEVPKNAFEIPIHSNPLVSCNSFKQINLVLWKEEIIN